MQVSPVRFAWDAQLDAWHEAVLYSGGMPDLLDLDVGLLLPEGNVFAVEVHNNTISSSDFTARPFLFLGAATPASAFPPPPSWFQAPTSNSHFVTFNLNMTFETVSPRGRLRGRWRLLRGPRRQPDDRRRWGWNLVRFH